MNERNIRKAIRQLSVAQGQIHSVMAGTTDSSTARLLRQLLQHVDRAKNALLEEPSSDDVAPKPPSWAKPLS